MNQMKKIFLASTLLLSTAVSASAELNVVTSVKPVHSLVAAVMQGVGEPDLIIEGAGSPHNYALKPSQARMLEQASVIFWVGEELEAFLEKPLETVGANAKSVALINAHDLIKLELREGGAFEDHGHDEEAAHDDHDHAETAQAAHDDDHDHDHDHDHDQKEAAEAGHEGHDHGAFDAHVWLDPANAKAMVHEIEEVLVAADPDNATQYEANAEAVMGKLDALILEVSAELEPVKDKGFIVFHDAYQYFENRFGIMAAGSITVSPEVMPGAQRVREIQTRLMEVGVSCVFAEPQFEPKLISTIIEGTSAKSGIIDPLGADLEAGPELYFQIIRNMATSIKTCLSAAS